MTTPHIHAEMIKAWADGYTVEAYNPERDAWIVCPEPGWFADIEYRVRAGEIEQKRPEYAEYLVQVDIDPLNPNNLEIFNTPLFDAYNLRLLFKDDQLIDVNIIGDEDEPW